MNGYFGVLLLDLKRFWIDRLKVLTSLMLPLLYLFVLGSGIGSSSQFGGREYQQYIYPGVIVLSLLFSATSTAIGITIDRRIGFLKGILVAPVSRTAITLGKVTSGAIKSLIPAIILLPLAPFIGVYFTITTLILLVLVMVLVALVFSALGVAIATRITSIEVFPNIVNTVLLPMFFLSGSMYLLDRAPAWLQALAYLNPVAYAVDLVRGVIYGHRIFSTFLSLTILIGLLLILTVISTCAFQNGDNRE